LSEELTGIARRIRRETSELNEFTEHPLRMWQKVSKDEDHLGSVWFDLQSYYQGVERFFEARAKSIDRSVPKGDKWRKMLLEQVAVHVEGRPRRSARRKALAARFLAFRVLLLLTLPPVIRLLGQRASQLGGVFS